MEFWDLDGTLSIFEVFDDFLGVGWIFGHYQFTGGPELNFSTRVDDAICGTIV